MAKPPSETGGGWGVRVTGWDGGWEHREGRLRPWWVAINNIFSMILRESNLKMI